MKRVWLAACCAASLVGCETTEMRTDIQPVADATETIKFDRGFTASFFDSKEVAIQVTALGLNPQRQVTFGLAVLNKTDHPINFGYSNLHLSNGDGRPIALFDRQTVERQVKNRALMASAALAVAGSLTAAAAASAAYTTSSGTIYTPHGAYSYQARTYDPELAAANSGAVTGATAAGLQIINQRLNATLENLNGQLLAPGTIYPGQSYGGVVTGDRLSSSYPQTVVLKVAEAGIEHSFRFNVTQYH